MTENTALSGSRTITWGMRERRGCHRTEEVGPHEEAPGLEQFMTVENLCRKNFMQFKQNSLNRLLQAQAPVSGIQTPKRVEQN